MKASSYIKPNRRGVRGFLHVLLQVVTRRVPTNNSSSRQDNSSVLNIWPRQASVLSNSVKIYPSRSVQLNLFTGELINTAHYVRI